MSSVFNNGNGGTICDQCRTMITAGRGQSAHRYVRNALGFLVAGNDLDFCNAEHAALYADSEDATVAERVAICAAIGYRSSAS
jgi:hypothetical protein